MPVTNSFCHFSHWVTSFYLFLRKFACSRTTDINLHVAACEEAEKTFFFIISLFHKTRMLVSVEAEPFIPEKSNGVINAWLILDWQTGSNFWKRKGVKSMTATMTMTTTRATAVWLRKTALLAKACGLTNRTRWASHKFHCCSFRW